MPGDKAARRRNRRYSVCIENHARKQYRYHSTPHPVHVQPHAPIIHLHVEQGLHAAKIVAPAVPGNVRPVVEPGAFNSVHVDKGCLAPASPVTVRMTTCCRAPHFGFVCVGRCTSCSDGQSGRWTSFRAVVAVLIVCRWYRVIGVWLRHRVRFGARWISFACFDCAFCVPSQGYAAAVACFGRKVSSCVQGCAACWLEAVCRCMIFVQTDRGIIIRAVINTPITTSTTGASAFIAVGARFPSLLYRGVVGDTCRNVIASTTAFTTTTTSSTAAAAIKTTSVTDATSGRNLTSNFIRNAHLFLSETFRRGVMVAFRRGGGRQCCC